jgi:tRNA(Ile)-lysidine synthase
MTRPRKIILAVSGGVDSMVLLDSFAKKEKDELIVAHFDHGIRKDSSKDRKLVEKAAKKYDLKFECEEGMLGSEAGEAKAREARYDFLRRIKSKFNADYIVTAHHQDDALETLLINLIRGTGRRGVLKETTEIKRPLLKMSKEEIIDYARAHKLKWREDSTNSDNRYLRNYVRNVLVPAMKEQDPESIEYLLDSNTSLTDVNVEIQEELDMIIDENIVASDTKIEIPRNWLIMLPNEVGREVLYEATRKLNRSIELTRKNIESMLVFSKTAKPNKKLELKKGIQLKSLKETILLELV